MKNVMVDLETLSSRKDAGVVAIGAVEFDFDSGELGKEFSCRVVPDERFHISGDTFLWWLQQSEAARQALLQEPRLSVCDACEQFRQWYPKGAALWGNGATFDNVILRHAYEVSGVKPPWHYRDDRCFRTLAAMLPKAPWPSEGVAHDALDDAKRQAKYLVAAWKLRAA